MQANTLSIIIVSYNAKEYLQKAIDSIFRSPPEFQFEVIVVENNSTDGSLEMLRSLENDLKIISLHKTVGFSEANNIGAKEALGEHVLFLNPDTEIIRDALSVLVKEMDKHPQLGALSCQLLNADGTIQPQGGSLPNLFKIFLWMFFIDDLPFVSSLFLPYQQRNSSFFTKKQKTGWIGGTAFLMRSDEFRKFGAWDSDIFLYGEDVEFCIRLQKQGKEIGFIPEAKIIHHQHKSTGGSSRSLKGEFEGMLYIWKKHFPAWQLSFLRLILFIGAWLRVLIFGILLHDETRKNTYLEIQKTIAKA